MTAKEYFQGVREASKAQYQKMPSWKRVLMWALVALFGLIYSATFAQIILTKP